MSIIGILNLLDLLVFGLVDLPEIIRKNVVVLHMKSFVYDWRKYISLTVEVRFIVDNLCYLYRLGVDSDAVLELNRHESCIENRELLHLSCWFLHLVVHDLLLFILLLLLSAVFDVLELLTQVCFHHGIFLLF